MTWTISWRTSSQAGAFKPGFVLQLCPAKPAYWTRIIGQGHGRRFLLVGVYRAVVTFEAPTELEVLAGAWTVLAGTAGARTELAVLGGSFDVGAVVWLVDPPEMNKWC
uniref:Uncharacterized protein n=1 Tax=Nothobranchius furzeri TaxID=105023 RepID=A0A1A8AN12_NOTFU